jgi:hypothetical protein
VETGRLAEERQMLPSALTVEPKFRFVVCIVVIFHGGFQSPADNSANQLSHTKIESQIKLHLNFLWLVGLILQ